MKNTFVPHVWIGYFCCMDKPSQDKFAVIFDMDGVVVDNFKYHRQAWKVFCERYNIEYNESLTTKVLGGTNKDHLEMFFQKKLDDNTIAKLGDEKEAIYREIYSSHIKPVKGLILFLQSLTKKNIPIALATSSPPINAEFVLSKTDTKKYFNHILHAGHVIKGKPDPEIFLKASDALQVPPESCIVFEDSIHGITAAVNANMKTIAITTSLQRDELPEVDLIIDDFTGLHVSQLKNLINFDNQL